jgi:hypothetical protein
MKNLTKSDWECLAEGLREKAAEYDCTIQTRFRGGEMRVRIFTEDDDPKGEPNHEAFITVAGELRSDDLTDGLIVLRYTDELPILSKKIKRSFLVNSAAAIFGLMYT